MNTAAISTYWEIGRLLEERKLDSKYGDGIIKRLSPRNLWDMKKFYLRYCESDTKLRQAVAVLPWSHNQHLLNHNLDSEHVVFYSNEVVAKGWSREMLRHALKSKYHIAVQTGEKSNNFTVTLSGTCCLKTNYRNLFLLK